MVNKWSVLGLLLLAAVLAKVLLPRFLPGSQEPEAEPAAQIIPLPVEMELEPEGETGFTVFHVIENCVVTYYDVCVICCGKTSGITASGTVAEPYATCAVDPRVIPLGSQVLVDYGDGELHAYRAEDTGSGVRKNHIDVCVSGHREALSLGIRRATVYWAEAGA